MLAITLRMIDQTKNAHTDLASNLSRIPDQKSRSSLQSFGDTHLSVRILRYPTVKWRVSAKAPVISLKGRRILSVCQYTSGTKR